MHAIGVGISKIIDYPIAIEIITTVFNNVRYAVVICVRIAIIWYTVVVTINQCNIVVDTISVRIGPTAIGNVKPIRNTISVPTDCNNDRSEDNNVRSW